MEYLLIIILIAFNIVSFALYGIDKAKAKLNGWRISEKTLMFWSLVGGIGAVAGMKTFHHKTLKPKFKAINTVGLLVNVFLLSALLMGS